MSADKRLCCKKSRPRGRSNELNYTSRSAYRKAMARLRDQKAGRKAARGGR